MITYNESTFSVNYRHNKVWILNSQGILRLRGREKGIIVSDFLLP